VALDFNDGWRYCAPEAVTDRHGRQGIVRHACLIDSTERPLRQRQANKRDNDSQPTDFSLSKDGRKNAEAAYGRGSGSGDDL
jgi:hypothetical protein